MSDPEPMADETPRGDRALPSSRRPGRARRITRLLLAAITLVLLVDAVIGEKGLFALLQARREYGAVERALERARADNATLRETARRLREDEAAIESAARKDLGLIRPGEKVFIIRDAAPRR
ncbi:MAG: septum formation initiator family protein [Vicinamibacterales bacterium]